MPEEDAASYEFFKCLREELYQNVPEPAVVLIDLSAGMTSAYDKLKCLPNSQLQYCTWHAAQAMKAYFHKAGRYPSEEVEVLDSLCRAYLCSNSEDDLEHNRKALEDFLQPQDKAYIIDNWKKREQRLIRCYTKRYTNLDQQATSRVEAYNVNIHKVANWQLSLHESAHQLTAFVNDFFRDFQEDLDKARGENVAGVDRQAFSYLRGTVSKEAIKLVAKQWRKLLSGSSSPCTGLWRKQHLLPCSHDLSQGYETGYPIPKSLVHPRWWIDGHIPTSPDWQPTSAPLQERARPANDLQALVYDTVAVVNQLPDDAGRRYERQLKALLQKHLTYGLQQVEFERLPLGNIDDHPCASRKPIPTINQRLEKEARQKTRLTAQRTRDDNILSQRADTQLTIGSHITVRSQSPVDFIISSTSSTSSFDDEPIEASRSQSELPVSLPPASTAPASLRPQEDGRSTRKRRGTGFYRALMAGDNQEIKRAKKAQAQA